MKTIKIPGHEVNAVTKKELLALGYEQVDDTMRKAYPAGIPLDREVGMVIFREVPGEADVYEVSDTALLSLSYYLLSWDANEFLDNVAKAVTEYRADMEKLGIPETPKDEKVEGEEE